MQLVVEDFEKGGSKATLLEDKMLLVSFFSSLKTGELRDVCQILLGFTLCKFWFVRKLWYYQSK